MFKQIKLGQVLLILMIAWALIPLSAAALASDIVYEPPPPGFGDPIRVDGSLVVPSGDPGQAVNVVIPLCFSREFGWNSVREITIGPVVSTDPEKWPFEIKQTTYTQSVMLSLSRARPTFTLTISQKAKAGVYPVDFELTYVAANGSTRETKKNTIRTYVSVLSDGTEAPPEEGADTGQITLISTPAPAAAYGERVAMTLELRNTGVTLSEVTVKPVISAELDQFPFVVERQSYEQSLGSFAAGTTRNVSYDFLLSEYVSAGAKAVKFTIDYSKNGVRGTGGVTAYVYVSRAKDSETEDDDENKDKKPQPKLIISSYGIEPEKIYAGNSFTLDMNFTNTSESPIQNLTIVITNADEENAYVVPAKNGSNTIYVRSLGPGATMQKTLELQVRPDTPAKPNMLLISMEYEDEDFAAHTAHANITVPINQEIRLMVDEPRFDMPFLELGMTAYPSFSVINMGKSSVYNVMITVEGPGLSLEDRAYAGTLQAGQQYNADIGVIANEPGQIDGAIVVSFEDEYGDKLEERRLFNLTVEEPVFPEFSGEGDFGEAGMFDPDLSGGPGGGAGAGFAGGNGKWWLAGGVLAAALVLFIVLRKRRAKKRQAELADGEID